MERTSASDTLGDELTPAQRAWADDAQTLWRQAHAIAARHPDDDPSDLYHALRCLRLSESERLRNGLSRGRLRAHSR